MCLRLYAAWKQKDEHDDLLRCLPTVFSFFIATNCPRLAVEVSWQGKCFPFHRVCAWHPSKQRIWKAQLAQPCKPDCSTADDCQSIASRPSIPAAPAPWQASTSRVWRHCFPWHCSRAAQWAFSLRARNATAAQESPSPGWWGLLNWLVWSESGRAQQLWHQSWTPAVPVRLSVSPFCSLPCPFHRRPMHYSLFTKTALFTATEDLADLSLALSQPESSRRVSFQTPHPGNRDTEVTKAESLAEKRSKAVSISLIFNSYFCLSS